MPTDEEEEGNGKDGEACYACHIGSKAKNKGGGRERDSNNTTNDSPRIRTLRTPITRIDGNSGAGWEDRRRLVHRLRFVCSTYISTNETKGERGTHINSRNRRTNNTTLGRRGCGGCTPRLPGSLEGDYYSSAEWSLCSYQAGTWDLGDVGLLYAFYLKKGSLPFWFSYRAGSTNRNKYLNNRLAV